MKIDISKQGYFPHHQDRKFKNATEFGRWLSATAMYKIEFVDNGQDCLAWWIDECGEVLNSNLQQSVWNGGVVDLSHLKVGKEIGVMCPKEQATKFYDFVVEKITKVTNKK